MNIFTMLGGEITALLSHKDARMEQFVVQGWRVKFINNSAMYGGALYASGVSMMLRDAEFRHNQAAVLGGGVCLERTTEVELGAVRILHNRWGAVCWTLIHSAVCCHVKRRRCLGLITAHRLCPQHSTYFTHSRALVATTAEHLSCPWSLSICCTQAPSSITLMLSCHNGDTRSCAACFSPHIAVT
jgi:predicted outer membrane repeat protein